MNRKRRTEILIKGNEELSKAFANKIREKYEIQIIEEPNNGLVMIKMRETAKRELFYLGEILVSEAKVYANKFLGMGIIAGYKEEMAINLAIIDAAFNGEFVETLLWEEILLREEQIIKYEEGIEERKIISTKVDFNTMDV